MLKEMDGVEIKLNINKGAWHYVDYSQSIIYPAMNNVFGIDFER
jgi:hypothetical protein